MNKKEVISKLRGVIKESEFEPMMTYSRNVLVRGIMQVVKELESDIQNAENKTVGNLVMKLNVNDSDLMDELVQVESKLARINELMDQVNEKIKKKHTIKIGVEVNE